MTTYLPVLIAALLALGLGVTFLMLFRLLGPYHRLPQKLTTYECGVPPTGDARGRFMIPFYLVAALFILFDIEVVFLYPWAILFKRLGIYGFIEMMIFILILVIGFLYIWRKGALEWQ